MLLAVQTLARLASLFGQIKCILEEDPDTDFADPAAVPAPLQRRGKPTEADCRRRLQTRVRSCMMCAQRTVCVAIRNKRQKHKSIAIWLT